MKRTEFTQKWLDALRSGNYLQARGRMHFAGTYCCLGVAARVSGVNIDLDDISSAYHGVYEKLGISKDESDDLVSLNDKQYKTFSEIADEIEKMLESE